jgi:hypothetical protein
MMHAENTGLDDVVRYFTTGNTLAVVHRLLAIFAPTVRNVDSISVESGGSTAPRLRFPPGAYLRIWPRAPKFH